jgi:hypothetical protein
MQLGIDRADQGTAYKLRSEVWTKFFDNDRVGKQPTFIGRYFSGGNFSWVAGELNGLIERCPSATSLSYVSPISNPGAHIVRDNDLWDDATITPSSWVVKLRKERVNFEIQGQRQNDFLPVKARDVESNGKLHGLKTCHLIQKALDYRDSNTGKPELVLPDSGLVFVFLDVEPQTWLHPAFWKGWAEAIFQYPMDFNDDLAYPLLPCIYCTCIQGDATNPGTPLESVVRAFDNKKVKPWNYKPFSVPIFKSLPKPYALMSLIFNFQTEANVNTMLRAGLTDAKKAWDLNAVCELSSPLFKEPAPLVIWQYLLNMAVDNGGNSFNPVKETARTPVFDMDFDVTSPVDYESRPITDFMLRRP